MITLSQGALREISRDAVASAATHLVPAFGTIQAPEGETFATIESPRDGTTSTMRLFDASDGTLVEVTVKVTQPSQLRGRLLDQVRG